MLYDVIIIGAGFTGAAVARALSRFNVNVCVLDKDVQPDALVLGVNGYGLFRAHLHAFDFDAEQHFDQALAGVGVRPHHFVKDEVVGKRRAPPFFFQNEVDCGFPLSIPKRINVFPMEVR